MSTYVHVHVCDGGALAANVEYDDLNECWRFSLTVGDVYIACDHPTANQLRRLAAVCLEGAARIIQAEVVTRDCPVQGGR